MATYKFAASEKNVEDRQSCPEGHVRFCFRLRQDDTPSDLDSAVLVVGGDPVDGDQKIGPYPAKVGSHWSDQPRGAAGYYVLVGPVPEADLPPELLSAVHAMDACNALDA